MHRFLKKIIVGLVVLMSIVGAANTLVPPTANAASCSESGHILTLPFWYNGLQETQTINGNTTCVIQISADNNFADVWHIILNVINILLQLIGLIAVGFVIYGGGRYIISQGNASQLTTAKQTITRALVGLIIAVSAVFILTFVTQNIFHAKVDQDTYQVSSFVDWKVQS